MSSLTISYFGGYSDGVALDPIATEVVTISGTTAQSGAVPKFAKFAKMTTDAACNVTQGTNPTATATAGAYIAADEVLWLRISQPTYKFAGITV